MYAIADIAIIGAGVTGLSVAFHLAERGAGSITVLEREGIGAGASGLQPGGVRQQWSTRPNCLLARASLAFHRALPGRLGMRVDPVFRQCGYLFVAHEQQTVERLRADVEVQNAAGVPSRLLTVEEVAEVVPDLAPAGIAGASFCAEDGYFDRPQSVVEGFAEAAQRLGVRVSSAEVVRIEPAARGWRVALADGTRTEAAQVVVAAAVDTRALLVPLGIDLPIVSDERWLFFSDPIADRLLDPLLIAVDRRFAAKQLGNGRVLASDLSARAVTDENVEEWRGKTRRAMTALLPRLEFVTLPVLVRGIYDLTPDHQAIVGPVPGHDGLFVAAGFSGHGFMFAPEIGRGVAGMVLGEDPGETFAHLRPDRFETGTLTHESAVV